MKLLYIVFFTFISYSNCVERFQIYWNVPAKKCTNLSLDDPEASIIHNEKLVFHGPGADKVAIVYGARFGQWPHINRESHEQFYGGIPQKGNLTAHFEKLQTDLDMLVPNPNFNGLFVIDMERWIPYYDLNSLNLKIYKNASLEYAKQQSPSLNETALEEKARNDWNKAAKQWFTGTINFVKKKRPGAKIGFYAYPITDHHVGQHNRTEIIESVQEGNDEMATWFYSNLDFLMPEIYLRKRVHGNNRMNEWIHIQANLGEARRIQDRLQGKHQLVPYTKFERDPKKGDAPHFYSDVDLCKTVTLARQMGANGAIFWSVHHTTREIKSNENGGATCDALTPYVNDRLVPYLAKDVQAADTCSKKQCSGHGTCYTKKMMTHCEELPFDEMNCVCDQGWMGDRCESELTNKATLDDTTTVQPN
ncbi:unnamed protein product, partial [Mesorhabditis belari]|uniref:Hyaluronidase n=1 Tax=Mesorhabditis belari TaxID=2138241 RepID=A0AAF3EKB3_9BILA